VRNILSFKLFEKNLSNVTSGEIVTKKFIDLQDNKDFLSPYAVQYAWEENRENIDPDNEAYDIIKTKEFQDWLAYELEYRFDNLKDEFNMLVRGNKVTLYREMMVGKDYLEKMKTGKIKRIGRYWTHDEDHVEPHWGHNDPKSKESIIFETDISQEHIDWIETFRLNLEHEYMNDEKEVRLFKNTPLILTNVTWNGNVIPANELEVINKFGYLA